MQLFNVSNSQVEEIVSRLDKIFKKDGLIIPVDSSVIESLGPNELRIYAHVRGIYQIITTELVQWFKDNVDLSNAIEIGSGNGTLGRALGIRMTDNWQQADPTVKLLYQMQGQPVIEYPDDIEKIDAISAIKKYKPSVVIGSWITNIYKEEEHELGGNASGVDEIELMQNVDKYLLVGNLNIHANNRLFRTSWITLDLIHEPFLYSRNANKNKNFIFEFTK